MGFAGKLLLEGRLLLALEFELMFQLARGKVVADRQHQDRDHNAHQDLDRGRPGTHVAAVQLVDVDPAQPFDPFGRTHSLSSPAAGWV
ncbi:hypothetical protein D9M71_759850 [compost metagenome]